MHTTNQWKDEGGYIARILRSSRVPTWAFIQPREIVYPKPTSSVNRASLTLRLVCPFNASLHVLPLISSPRLENLQSYSFRISTVSTQKKIHRATKFPIGHLSGKLWAAELKEANFLTNRIIFINVTNFVTPPFNKHFCICDACSKFYMLAMWLFSTF